MDGTRLSYWLDSRQYELVNVVGLLRLRSRRNNAHNPTLNFMLYTCTAFTGFYPVGTAAVVNALDEFEAANLLNEALRHHGLSGDISALDMRELPSDETVRILCDGNY